MNERHQLEEKLQYKLNNKKLLMTAVTHSSYVKEHCLLGITVYIYLNTKNIYFSKLGIPECPFHYITGYYCPGFGGTRAFDAFIHLHWITSLKFHPLILITFYFYVIGLIGYIPFIIKNTTRYIYHINFTTLLYIDYFIVVWFIVRNIYVYIR